MRHILRRFRGSRQFRDHLLLLGQIGTNALVGYVFSRMLASMFGVSASKDGFDIAYSVPFIVLYMSGFAFGHAVIATQFARLRVAAPHKLQSVFSTTLNAMLLICAGLLGMCFVWSRQVIAVLGPGLSPEVQEQARQCMLLMLPLTLTLGLSTYLSAVLVGHSVPLASEFCQLASRLGVLGWFFLVGPHLGFNEIAIGLVAASVVGLAVEWHLLRRMTGLRFTRQFLWRDPEFRTIVWQGGTFLVAALAAQSSTAYMRRLATLDGVGTNAMLTYCFSLIVPLSVLVGKPLAIAMGPEYVRLFASRRILAARRMLARNIAICLAGGALMTAVLAIFPVPIVRLFYAGGSFDERAVALTAELCGKLAWSLPAAITLWVVLMPILGSQQPAVPALVYIAGYVAQIAIMAALFPVWGKGGLVGGYLAGLYLQAALSVVVVVRELLPAREPVCHEMAG